MRGGLKTLLWVGKEGGVSKGKHEHKALRPREAIVEHKLNTVVNTNI